MEKRPNNATKSHKPNLEGINHVKLSWSEVSKELYVTSKSH